MTQDTRIKEALMVFHEDVVRAVNEDLIRPLTMRMPTREEFVAQVDLRRRRLGLSWRQVGYEADVLPSTITRLNQGKDVSSKVVFSLADWLNRSANCNDKECECE